MALWLPDLDAVFIAIPRTGSQWVRAALDVSGLRCVPANGPGDHGLPDAYRRPGRRFCFVRHPVTWLESAWRGLHDSWPNRRELASLHRERTWSPIRNLTYLAGDRTFPGFIETLLSREPGFVTRMYESYIGPVGYPRVDFVGRKECLAADLQRILTLLGWTGTLSDLPPVNEGSGPSIEWGGLMPRVLASERPAIDRWYTSDGPFGVTTE